MPVRLLLPFAQNGLPKEHSMPAQHIINMQNASGQATCEERCTGIAEEPH